MVFGVERGPEFFGEVAEYCFCIVVSSSLSPLHRLHGLLEVGRGGGDVP